MHLKGEKGASCLWVEMVKIWSVQKFSSQLVKLQKLKAKKGLEDKDSLVVGKEKYQVALLQNSITAKKAVRPTVLGNRTPQSWY